MRTIQQAVCDINSNMGSMNRRFDDVGTTSGYSDADNDDVSTMTIILTIKAIVCTHTLGQIEGQHTETQSANRVE